jgi:hypothetical protein
VQLAFLVNEKCYFGHGHANLVECSMVDYFCQYKFV